MKRLLTLFTVVLLSACGSDATYTPPETPYSLYPDLTGTFTDLRGFISVCTEFDYRKMELQIAEQRDGDLIGTFSIELADGSMSTVRFSGTAGIPSSSTSRVRGIAGTQADGLSFDMEAIGNDYISGTATATISTQCADGSFDRAEVIAGFDR